MSRAEAVEVRAADQPRAALHHPGRREVPVVLLLDQAAGPRAEAPVVAVAGLTERNAVFSFLFECACRQKAQQLGLLFLYKRNRNN